MLRISKITKERYARIINDLINDLGRGVTVYKPSLKNECPNCYYDKVSDTSTNTCKWTALEALTNQESWIVAGNNTLKYQYFLKGRCPICLGKGYLEIKQPITIKCIVEWDFDSAQNNVIIQTPSGVEGSTLLELKTHIRHLNLFKNCESVKVDGVTCFLATPPLIRGLGNQSTLIIILYTDSKIDLSTHEIVKDYR